MEESVIAVSKAMEEVKIGAVPKKHHGIQVFNTLFFYFNLAKRYMKEYNGVELSALVMGIYCIFCSWAWVSNKPTTNTSAEAPVTENSKELTTNTSAEAPVSENSQEVTTNTAAMELVTENSQGLTTSTASMDPVTENCIELTKPRHPRRCWLCCMSNNRTRFE